MLKPTLAIPLACCLVAGALAGCSGTDATPSSGALVSSAGAQEPTAARPDSSVSMTPSQQLVAVGDRVYFAYDSSVLAPDAQRILQRQAAWLKQNPMVTLTVEGHADERGTREYNIALGARRSDAVRDFLIAQGIGSERLRTVSYGKERPQTAGADEASWAQNRRGVSVAR